MIHKPKRIATRLGTFGEMLYAIAPKSIDAILNTAYKLFPDSSAAKGEKRASARPRTGPRRTRRRPGSRSPSPT